MVDVRASGLASIDFAERLLDAEGVCLLPCDAFGPNGVGYLRMSLSVPYERLVETCDRMERFLAGLSS
ncbi:MAG: hypothetical protein O7F17_06780 [Planctomycetota bacterium]|nr:hypothetical protein [Planctomycetota bacterium]